MQSSKSGLWEELEVRGQMCLALVARHRLFGVILYNTIVEQTMLSLK